MPEGAPADVLRQRLGQFLKCPLNTITLTDNRARIFSARPAPEGEAIDLRIHHSFVDAPEAVLRAVSEYLRSSRGSRLRRAALATIRHYFDNHRTESPPPRRRTLRPVGDVWDLRELRDRLNKRYFDEELDVQITWGRAPSRKKKRRQSFSIRLGSYNHSENLVRIHPHLDRPSVPEFVVEAVVYHEMLHAAVPPVVKNGRRYLHTPEFRRRERLYHRFVESERWLADHLPQLAGCS